MTSQIDLHYIQAAHNGDVEALKRIERNHKPELLTLVNSLYVSVNDHAVFRHIIDTHAEDLKVAPVKELLSHALGHYVSQGKKEDIKWALSRGADPRLGDVYRLAATGNDFEVIDLLLATDPNEPNWPTLLAFYALEYDNQALLDYLMVSPDYKAARPDKLSLAAGAAGCGDLKLLEKITKDYNVDLTDRDNVLYKTLVNATNDIEIYRYLESKGAHPGDMLNEIIFSCLNRSYPHLMEHFLDKYNASTDIKTDQGETLLHIAASNGGAECEVLLNRGADVTKWNQDKKTPVYNAIAAQKPDALKQLLAHGSHLFPCDGEKGLSALDFATEEQWQMGIDIIYLAHKVFNRQFQYIATIDVDKINSMDDIRQLHCGREPSQSGGFGIDAKGLVIALFSADSDAVFDKIYQFGAGALKPEDANFSVRISTDHQSFDADLTDIIVERRVVHKLFDERLWTGKAEDMKAFFETLPKKLQDQAQEEYTKTLSTLRIQNKVAAQRPKLKSRRPKPGR